MSQAHMQLLQGRAKEAPDTMWLQTWEAEWHQKCPRVSLARRLILDLAATFWRQFTKAWRRVDLADRHFSFTTAGAGTSTALCIGACASSNSPTDLIPILQADEQSAVHLTFPQKMTTTAWPQLDGSDAFRREGAPSPCYQGIC